MVGKMDFYHVAVVRKSAPEHPEFQFDLDRSRLEERFLQPRLRGQPLTIGGMTVELDDLERLQVARSKRPSQSLRKIAQARERTEREQDRAAGILDLRANEPLTWRVFRKATDVTDELVTGVPGSLREDDQRMGGALGTAADTTKVFVVYGRNEGVRRAMFEFLRSLGLQPLEWNQAISATKNPTPYIGEALDAAFTKAQAVLVLLTPDDEARLKDIYAESNDLPYERNLTGQARPNVLFEAGMAMGRAPDRTILVELGDLRPFSDIAGRHVIRFDGSSQRRQELAQRLAAAGCPVNRDGTDWHNAGDFKLK